MRDEEEATDEPSNPRLYLEQSPGFGVDPMGLKDVEVDRDVTIGEATLADLGANDTKPVEDHPVSGLPVSLASDGAVECRRAAFALVERGDGRIIVKALSYTATTDRDVEVRQFAMEALAKHGSDLTVETARTLIDDSDPWVRVETAAALDHLDRREHEVAIKVTLDDEHRVTRRNTLVSFFRLHGEGTYDALVAVADDPNERVREWAAHLLDGVGTNRATKALPRLADDEQSVV